MPSILLPQKQPQVSLAELAHPDRELFGRARLVVIQPPDQRAGAGVRYIVQEQLQGRALRGGGGPGRLAAR